MVTTATAAVKSDAAEIILARAGAATPVLAAWIPANAAALGQLDADIAGSAPTERGFALLKPADDGRLAVSPFAPGDRVVLFAPRRHRIRHGSGRPGTRLTMTCVDDGALVSALTSHAYRPASSTALAALSGGRDLAAGGAAGSGDIVEAAANLAEAYWKRARLDTARMDDPSGGTLSGIVLRPAQPLAKLTATAADHAAGEASPLMAAIGAALALPPALVEELDALAAADQAALAVWAATDRATAGEACRARLILPARSQGAADAATASAVKAASAQDFGRMLAELTARLALRPDSEERTAGLALVRGVMERLGSDWTPASDVAAAMRLLALNPPPQDASGPFDRLLADLKGRSAAWSAAQRDSASADLAMVGEQRANLSGLASAAGLAEDLIDAMQRRLPSLAAAEVVVLHRHLSAQAERQAVVRSVRLAVLALDEAAGSGGLASRIDRNGDPLVGMTRIGTASEQVVRLLIAMPEAREALVAVTGWINASVPQPPEGHELSQMLVRNLKSYGCFLLMNAIVAECRELIAPANENAAAFARRLGSGLAETLPRFAAAAVARAGEDVSLGMSLARRLPAVHEKAAS